MLRDQIKEDILEAIGRLGYWSGGKMVPKNLTTQKPSDLIEVTRTSDGKFGDFTTNIALKLSKYSSSGAKRVEKSKKDSSRQARTIDDNKQTPLEVARKLADSLGSLPYVKKLEVAGPGFINFFIKDEIWQCEVEKVLELKSKYGSNRLGEGKKARVEFVSANPTGPLHFGNARGGPIGDVLASVLEFSGYKVLREFYANDVGGQVNKLGESILAVAHGGKLEDQEYKGEYVRELAAKIRGLVSGKLKIGDESNAGVIGVRAVDLILAQIEDDCRDMGIRFDMIYPESKFLGDGETKASLEKLEKKKMLKKKDGATWFAPSDEFLKDRETVVIKSDGSYTYFANDIAYHELKFSDGYDLVILVIGANHHGHIPRLQAAISALGFDVSKFKVILYQWVRFKKGQEVLAMSKRSGNFITTREILDMVGKDALRFFILMHDASSHIDFDLDLAREKSSKNPVYYVQYAHARIASILAKTNDEYSSSEAEGRIEKFSTSSNNNYSLLATDYELNLIKQISRLPELVEEIAGNYSVHQLTTYATQLADSFHKFYENCQVLPASTRDCSSTRGGTEDEKLTSARLGLVQAAKIALANTLSLLGVSAPEKM